MGTGRRAKRRNRNRKWGHEVRVPWWKPRDLQAWAEGRQARELPYLGSGS